MSDATITTFYSQDHEQLDRLFERFQALKATAPDEALETLRKFRHGLEQHMAWEEAILFSNYDQKQRAEDGLTAQLLLEHGQIRDRLEAIEAKLRNGDTYTNEEEERFSKILASHNRTEENEFYVKLDRFLTDDERMEIFNLMRLSAWPGPSV